MGLLLRQLALSGIMMEVAVEPAELLPLITPLAAPRAPPIAGFEASPTDRSDGFGRFRLPRPFELIIKPDMGQKKTKLSQRNEKLDEFRFPEK